jgi:hypothetical protein
MLTIPDHNGNVSQTTLRFHSLLWDGYHQEHKQQRLASVWRKKEPLYPVGGNVN